LTVFVAYGSQTWTPSEGGEAAMLGHEFLRGNAEISWDDGTEFVATTRVRRPVVVVSTHAVVLLPITLAPLLPSLVGANEGEISPPEGNESDTTTGFCTFHNSP
jgi:hypothetical protein